MWGVGCNSWGMRVQCRWEKGLGLRLGLGLGLGKLEEKWREKEKNVKKIQLKDKMIFFNSK